MGVLYIVVPLDDEEREWLKEAGVTLPRGRQRTRNPTPAEIREVCDALDGFKVKYKSSTKNKFWQAIIEGIKGRDRNRGTIVNIDNWGGSEERRTRSCSRRVTPLSSSISSTVCQSNVGRWW